MPNTVNPQVTDAVTQADEDTEACSPAMEQDDAAQDATSAQQQANIAQQDATTQGVAVLEDEPAPGC